MKLKHSIMNTEAGWQNFLRKSLGLSSVLLITLLMTSCSLTPTPPTVQTAPVTTPILIQEKPARITKPKFDKAINVVTFETIYNGFYRDVLLAEIEHVLKLEGNSTEAARARAQVFVAEMDEYAKNNQGVFVYFAFEEDNYLTFASWLEQTLNYIKEQNAIINYYEDIAKQRNKKLEKKR